MPNVNSRIIKRVTHALLDDSRTLDAVIEVSAQGGMVTLSGSVVSPEIRAAAEEIARQQKGVISVINDLSLSTDEGETQPIVPMARR